MLLDRMYATNYSFTKTLASRHGCVQQFPALGLFSLGGGRGVPKGFLKSPFRNPLLLEFVKSDQHEELKVAANDMVEDAQNNGMEAKQLTELINSSR